VEDQNKEEEFKKSYEKYRSKDTSIHNDRARPDGQNLLDALMSVDMENDPDGKRAIEIIKAL